MNIKRAVKKEMKRAKRLHDWPKDQVHQVAKIAEEAGEALQAANNHLESGAFFEFFKNELIETIVKSIRFLEANK